MLILKTTIELPLLPLACAILQIRSKQGEWSISGESISIIAEVKTRSRGQENVASLDPRAVTRDEIM